MTVTLYTVQSFQNLEAENFGAMTMVTPVDTMQPAPIAPPAEWYLPSTQCPVPKN